MNKRILLPTDFSKNAQNAARYALDLYKDQNCDFYFLNAYQVKGYSTSSMMVPEPREDAYEKAKNKSKDGLANLMDALKLNKNSAKHTYKTISAFNSLFYAIKDTIAKKDIDLIVMGTKGSTGSKAVIFGTNTMNIMEKVTECPVIGVPSEYGFSPLKEIVFPTNYKTVYKRKMLASLLEIAKMHKASIRVLFVSKESELSQEQENNKELLDAEIDGIEHSFHTLMGKNVADRIQSFMESRGSDMVAFINKKHLFFGSILSNPLIKKIGYDLTTPVLVLKDVS